MNVTRRQVLLRAGATAALALSGAAVWSRDERVASAQSGLIPTSMKAAVTTLLLHDGSAMAAAFVRELRASGSAGSVSDVKVSVLTLRGFSAASALLKQSRGAALLSLLDDADSVVMEAVLKCQGAHNQMRQRRGAQVLLSANL